MCFTGKTTSSCLRKSLKFYSRHTSFNGLTYISQPWNEWKKSVLVASINFFTGTFCKCTSQTITSKSHLEISSYIFSKGCLLRTNSRVTALKILNLGALFSQMLISSWFHKKTVFIFFQLHFPLEKFLKREWKDSKSLINSNTEEEKLLTHNW